MGIFVHLKYMWLCKDLKSGGPFMFPCNKQVGIGVDVRRPPPSANPQGGLVEGVEVGFGNGRLWAEPLV